MTTPAGDQWNPTCVAEETCCKLLGKLIKGRCDLTIREGYTEHFSHMPVRERDGVCWEKRCSLLWHFTRGNLVGSLVTSAVSLEGSADTNAGSRGTKPSSSLCYGAPLPWQVYIEKTFSDFPLPAFGLDSWPAFCSKESPQQALAATGHWVMPLAPQEQLWWTPECPNLSDVTTPQQATRFFILWLVYKMPKRFFFSFIIPNVW